MVTTHAPSLSHQLSDAFKIAQKRTEQIFNMVASTAYYEKPIPLRHPFVFYDGHIPAFIWNTLFRGLLNNDSFSPELDRLFARGIDPRNSDMADTMPPTQWPTKEQTQAYREQVYRHLYPYLETAKLANHANPMLRDGYILHLLLEHELMHQETLMYLIHQLPHPSKNPPTHLETDLTGPAHRPSMQDIPEGITRLGAYAHEADYVWDNELPAHEIHVPAFAMDVYNVTNREFLAFIEDGGYQNKTWWAPETWQWVEQTGKTHPSFWRKSGDTWQLRDLFTDIPLAPDWPVYVTHAEARAYAQYRGKSLPTEAQWNRAAVGDYHHWRYPWGNTPPNESHGNFNFQRYSPVPVGSFPAGASPYGIHDLVGNGWEWTSTPFQPFSGFHASPGYPQYSTDFFDGQHVVLKGGSPFTDARLLRRSFRNWFYWDYPYAYTTFRCVRNT